MLILNKQTQVLNFSIGQMEFSRINFTSFYISLEIFFIKASQPGFYFNKEYINDENIMNEYKGLMTSVIGYMYTGEKNLTSDIQRIFELEMEFSMVSFSFYSVK